jgi:hypothetical protein
MDRKLLLLFGTMLVVAVSGCIMQTTTLTTGDGDQNSSLVTQIVAINDTGNRYRCPTGEYVSDASECSYHCGDDECSAGETYTTCPGDCCYSAMAVIAGAEYSDEDSIITLHINNAGDFELSFSAVVEYDDASMKIIKSLYVVPAGGTESIKIENVDSNMESVRIIAAECPEVEDFITRENIIGL